MSAFDLLVAKLLAGGATVDHLGEHRLDAGGSIGIGHCPLVHSHCSCNLAHASPPSKSNGSRKTVTFRCRHGPKAAKATAIAEAPSGSAAAPRPPCNPVSRQVDR